jgi:S1-C subfamily serine protease
MLHRLFRCCLVLAVLQAALAQADAPTADAYASVLRVEVTRTDGSRELGSAVALAGERLVTNCHVLRNAARIAIQLPDGVREARAEQRDAYRDLCFLTLPGHAAPPLAMIELGATRVGLEVVAVGYPGGAFATRPGKVIGLHACECDGGRVIQTSAPFDRGASGGGLFDWQGRLVGILTFKARTGGDFHFALPVGWLRHLAEQAGAAGDTGKTDAGQTDVGQTFWELPGKESGYFLAACDLGASQNWRALQRLAEEWCEQEPNNPEAWMAMGRALRGQERIEAAVAAFQKVLMLDSTHAEAKWALQVLELDLGRTLLSPEAL